ncbi:hypothetical protein [Isoalcanivorax beigongshangi]|uniref:Uncharacterized protein n=1 Tax=Isoalcanivorax beigongshangi TaxID=3238810 RepID=A0ABV4AKR4_9GAMM
MTEKQIASVPEHLWGAGQAARGRSWDAQYNVAAWVRISAGRGSVRLLLRYTDEQGVQQLVVDSATVSGAGTVLLSSMVSARLHGRPTAMQAVLVWDDPALQYSVEELYVQPAGQPAVRQEKLISVY